MAYDPNGFLLPPWYVPEQPTELDLNIASIIWGFSLACGVFTFFKAVKQSWKSYRRGKIWNAYIIMVWSEWTVCIVISIVGWLYLSPSLSILPGFWIFFWLLVLWVVQIQCILQIIINRVRLLMVDHRRADQLKWIVAIFVGLINISVFIIWIPARLQISEKWVEINNCWDRVEKTLFGLCDIGLNLYFIYLVRSKLIANGLKKYTKLLRFNMMMICISMSLDAILIGMMSLPNSAIYIQFHPLAYLVKLHIEMNVAELIAKIVKATNHLNEYQDSRYITLSNDCSQASRQAAKIQRSSQLKGIDSIDMASYGRELADLQLSKSTGSTVFESGPQLEEGRLEKRDEDIKITQNDEIIVCKYVANRPATSQS
ncbi:hypothetical protein AB5N19_04532 [Seiridium cardinale]